MATLSLSFGFFCEARTEHSAALGPPSVAFCYNVPVQVTKLQAPLRPGALPVCAPPSSLAEQVSQCLLQMGEMKILF